MGYTIPVGDYLYRSEIPSRLLRYFADTQHRQKQYLRHLHHIYGKRYQADPDDPYLRHLRNDVVVWIAKIETLRDVIHQIHILQKVARVGRRPHGPKFVNAESIVRGYPQLAAQ